MSWMLHLKEVLEYVQVFVIVAVFFCGNKNERFAICVFRLNLKRSSAVVFDIQLVCLL
jgi:hypothetical protein